jgi:negative regulator of sigma E activity
VNPLAPDEILSEYLDGELTPPRRAEVEKWLASDPAARQLLDELRAIGDALRTLPRRKVGEDLSHRVLRAAERRILLEGLPDELGNPLLRPTPPARRAFRRVLSRRTVVWLTAAAAVVVAILIVDRQQRRAGPGAEGDRQLARPVQPIRSDEGPPAAASLPNHRQAPVVGRAVHGTTPRDVVRATPPGDANSSRATLSAGPPAEPADRLPAIPTADLARLADGVLVIHFDVTA